MGLGLVTDLYQLTMAAGYFEAGKTQDRATFELSVRRLPYNRNFVLAAGLAQAVEYLLNFRITPEEIAYLRGIPQFKYASGAFFKMLGELRFTGDVFAVPEGTPVFAGEPFLTVRAPIVEAQIPETYLLAMIGFQSSIATKAARVVKAALGRDVVEFGTRRAHSPEAGVLAGRAAYIGGCVGTSNAEAGFRYKAHVFGTAAHSWVMSFPSERAAFEQLQKLLGERTTYLIDTYDTIEGAKLAASLGKPLWKLCGSIAATADRTGSGGAGKILDDAGLTEAKIMATGDLNEYKIHELVAARAPIDVFGVGTDLATSADAPSLGVIYKMVEMESAHQHRYTAKLSYEKHTLPGAKQIFRHADYDVLGRSTECISCGDDSVEALQHPVILGGKLVERLPSAAEAKRYAADRLARLPAPCHSLFQVENAWRVDLSPGLKELDESVRKELAG